MRTRRCRQCLKKGDDGAILNETKFKSPEPFPNLTNLKNTPVIIKSSQTKSQANNETSSSLNMDPNSITMNFSNKCKIVDECPEKFSEKIREETPGNTQENKDKSPDQKPIKQELQTFVEGEGEEEELGSPASIEIEFRHFCGKTQKDVNLILHPEIDYSFTETSQNSNFFETFQSQLITQPQTQTNQADNGYE